MTGGLKKSLFDLNSKRLQYLTKAAIFILIAGFLSSLVTFAHSARAEDKKPNIVVIMGDDIGWFNISAYHRGIMSGKTPNLDKLAGGGLRLTNAHAGSATCTPSRYSLLTGQYAWRRQDTGDGCLL